MDFVDGTLILVIKDDEWNEEQILAAKERFEISCGYTTGGLLIFLAEGGPLDTCDFYFNIQECDEKDALLSIQKLPVCLVLLDQDNVIRVMKRRLLSLDTTQQLKEMFQKQNAYAFGPDEFEVNAQGMQNALEPAEMGRYMQTRFSLK